MIPVTLLFGLYRLVCGVCYANQWVNGTLLVIHFPIGVAGRVRQNPSRVLLSSGVPRTAVVQLDDT